MKNFISHFTLILLLALPHVGNAAGSGAELDAFLKKLKADTTFDNVENYARAHYNEFRRLLHSDLDGAEKLLAKMEKDLASVTGSDKKAADRLKRVQLGFRTLRKQLENFRLPEEDLLQALKKHPNLMEILYIYHTRRYSEIESEAQAAPDKAETKLKALREFYADIKKRGNESTGKQVDYYLKALTRVDSSIEAGRKMMKVIGQPAAPLDVEAWANGKPLTDADLKGKVVLLDFWAVWCGPCIATFPHLNEWNEKYADKGLVTIGLTRWYNFAWKNGKATRGKDVPHPEELEMLEKFAAQHKLEYPFAIQKDDSLSEFYGVRGIPHAVLIDRQGKVALMRSGSGEDNAKAISEKLEELIAAKP